jgi:hypothetical protein
MLELRLQIHHGNVRSFQEKRKSSTIAAAWFIPHLGMPTAFADTVHQRLLA